MNEDIEKLKDKLKKTLENYELDKKFGQLSVDSIYSMFPTESKLLLDYIEQLLNNWNELKQWLDLKGWDERFLFLDTILEKMEELEGKK